MGGAIGSFESCVSEGGDARGVVIGKEGDAKSEGDVGADGGSFGVAGEVGRGCCAAVTTSSAGGSKSDRSRAPWSANASNGPVPVPVTGDDAVAAAVAGALLTVGRPSTCLELFGLLAWECECECGLELEFECTNRSTRDGRAFNLGRNPSCIHSILYHSLQDAA